MTKKMQARCVPSRQTGFDQCFLSNQLINFKGTTEMVKLIKPDYYDKFSCTADKCPDNCCIGWEIDIDDETYAKYMSLDGKLGEQLKENTEISEDGSHCFKLKDGDRCPFLNEHNLCDIILSVGEGFLCNICNDHPRFNNCFGDMRETGVGISCMTAAELILTKQDKTIFTETESDEKSYDNDFDADLLNAFLNVRRQLLDIAQDRTYTITERLSEMLVYAEQVQSCIEKDSVNDIDFTPVPIETEEYKKILQKLIPLNDEWTAAAENMKCCIDEKIDENAVEQLAVYYIYRHFLSAVYDGYVLSRVKLAVFCCLVSIWLANSVKADSFTDKLVKSACLVSKEIEYCSENIDALLDMSWTEKCLSTECLLYVLNLK